LGGLTADGADRSGVRDRDDVCAGRHADRRDGAVAFFGVRGIGSLYYLAYATGEAPELASDSTWSAVACTVTASVIIHGVLATPVMYRVGEHVSAS
jgi:NhaP-type Na+/H+ or K+/H+ antiporter